jgi:hypothetical protein
MMKQTTTQGCEVDFDRAVTEVKICFLTNLFTGNNFITPELSGTQGQGKTTIAKDVARALNKGANGYCITVEGDTLGEGEISGLPFAVKTGDEKSADFDDKVTFEYVKHYAIKRIKAMQKEYYNIAKTTGFLKGTVKLLPDGRTQYPLDVNNLGNGKFGYIEAESGILKVADQGVNAWAFGEELPPEVKLALLESQDFHPTILFIDEVNRTDNATMKNIMNIFLSKAVNDYRLPWWVNCLSASNPSGGNFSTTSKDPAQLDRFLKIPVSLRFDSWFKYELKNKFMSPKYILAISADENKLFSPEDITGSDGESADQSNSYDCEIPTPSPRSHEMMGIMYMVAPVVKYTSFFDSDERSDFDGCISDLIIDKMGRRYGNQIVQNILHCQEMIDPKDIFTGTSKTIPDDIRKKFVSLNILPQFIVGNECVNFIASKVMSAYVLTSSTNADERKKNIVLWNNYLGQITDFFDALGMYESNAVVVARAIVNRKNDVPDEVFDKAPTSRLHPGDTFYAYVANCFSSSVLKSIEGTNKAVNAAIKEEENN